MTFLLDTNVVSEWTKPRPDQGVVDWLAAVDEDRVFLSVITLAETRRGIERLAAGSRRQRLDTWLREVLAPRFEDRVLPVDATVADRWGTIVAARETAGRPIASMDALIAATAAVHALTLVTRNTRDFEGSVDAMLDPWAA